MLHLESRQKITYRAGIIVRNDCCFSKKQRPKTPKKSKTIHIDRNKFLILDKA